jgi:hypothetical protein
MGIRPPRSMLPKMPTNATDKTSRQSAASTMRPSRSPGLFVPNDCAPRKILVEASMPLTARLTCAREARSPLPPAMAAGVHPYFSGAPPHPSPSRRIGSLQRLVSDASTRLHRDNNGCVLSPENSGSVCFSIEVMRFLHARGARHNTPHYRYYGRSSRSAPKGRMSLAVLSSISGSVCFSVGYCVFCMSATPLMVPLAFSAERDGVKNDVRLMVYESDVEIPGRHNTPHYRCYCRSEIAASTSSMKAASSQMEARPLVLPPC